MCKSIFTSLSHWISPLCHGEIFDIKFEPYLYNGSKVSGNTNETVPAITTSVLDSKRMNRKRSHIEIQKHGKRSHSNTSSFNNRKNHYKRIKECVICVSKGHGRFVCPELTVYGTPLPDKNPRSR